MATFISAEKQELFTRMRDILSKLNEREISEALVIADHVLLDYPIEYTEMNSFVSSIVNLYKTFDKEELKMFMRYARLTYSSRTKKPVGIFFDEENFQYGVVHATGFGEIVHIDYNPCNMDIIESVCKGSSTLEKGRFFNAFVFIENNEFQMFPAEDSAKLKEMQNSLPN